MNIESFIEKYEPCSEATTWLLTQSDLQSAWDTCTRIDWMLWALEKAGISEQQNAKLAAEFVFQTPLSDGSPVADLLTDQRSIDFLQLKKAWGDAEPGAPQPERWKALREAAWDAYGEAWKAARAAVYEAARAAGYEAAVYEAASAAASAAEREAEVTGTVAEEKQCNIVRSIFPVCPF